MNFILTRAQHRLLNDTHMSTVSDLTLMFLVITRSCSDDSSFLVFRRSIRVYSNDSRRLIFSRDLRFALKYRFQSTKSFAGLFKHRIDLFRNRRKRLSGQTWHREKTGKEEEREREQSSCLFRQLFQCVVNHHMSITSAGFEHALSSVVVNL